jgi:ribosomal protein S18 acetylase RimI-like enzyme
VVESGARVRVRLMTEDDRAAVGLVLARALSDKWASMLPSRPEVAAALLADLSAPSPTTWVAEAEGRVVGVLLTEEQSRSFWGHGHWRVLRRRLRLMATVRAAAFLTVFHWVKFPETHLYVDSIAVDPAFQGRGMGTMLLDAVTQEARRRGKRALWLYCVERNTRARALYERYGFRFLKRDDLWWCAWLLGFRKTDLLELKLSLPSAAGGVEARGHDLL